MASCIVGVKIINDHFALTWVIKLGLDVIKSGNSVSLCNVQGAFIKNKAIGSFKSFQQDFDLSLTSVVNDCIDIAEVSIACKHSSFIA